MKGLHLAFNNRIDRAITKVDIDESNIGDKKGFCFAVTWKDRDYPNFVSALYKTRLGTTRKAIKYLKTGEYSLYGNAE